MKALIIIRGLPGAGKTSFARMLGTGPVVSADDYFMKDGKYVFDKEKLGAAHRYCQNETAAYMHEGKGRIYVANTFTTEKEIKPYYELAKKYGYIVYCVIIENRHNGINIHNVPDNILTAMKQRFDIKL